MVTAQRERGRREEVQEGRDRPTRRASESLASKLSKTSNSPAALLPFDVTDLCPAVLARLRVLSVDCCDSSTTHGNFTLAMERIRSTDLRATAACLAVLRELGRPGTIFQNVPEPVGH